MNAVKQGADPARSLEAVTKLTTCVIPFKILVSTYIEKWCSVLLSYCASWVVLCIEFIVVVRKALLQNLFFLKKNPNPLFLVFIVVVTTLKT